MKEYKTTPEQFELFKKYVNYYIIEFNLFDWAVYFELKRLDDCQARCSTDIKSRVVTFSLGIQIYYTSDEDIKNCALHEVCHLLIADISDLAYKRSVTFDQIEQAAETVTRRIQALLKRRTRW